LSVAKLTTLLQPLVEDLGYEFVGLEIRNDPGNRALVVYIDQANGVAIEDCERTSREVAALLDVEDPISGQYVLEVSSPGLDRPLFSPQQFAKFAGEVVQISLYAPHDGRRKFRGRILGVTDDKVDIEQDGTRFTLEHGNIAKARLVPDYDSILAGKV
jgi:ribosome maturation factor RimP